MRMVKSNPEKEKEKLRVIVRARSARANSNDKLTDFIKPMLAQIHDKPFNDEHWIFEAKWDGYRAVAEIKKNQVRLYSRNGLSFLRLYPEVAQALEKIKDEMILDGEIVVLNENNKPDFQKLQQFDEHRSLKIVYYVFDCLSYKGKSLVSLPLIERKKILEQALPKSEIIQYSDHVMKSGVDFFSKVSTLNLEGMIAKRAASTYVMGKRSADWLKIKNHNTQEAVICGYTAPRGSRSYFGALILGIYDQGKLKYIGHTGTGFKETTLKEVYQKLEPYKQTLSPFKEKISVNSPVTWVEPKFVCNIKYTEATEDGILRHPVFQGIRIDKTSREANHIDKSVDKKNLSTSMKVATEKQNPDTEERNIHGHLVSLTHQNKIYWPEEGITKGEVIEYYNGIHKYILPYLKDRPQSLKRNPNGIRDKGFYHKDAGDKAPEWVDTITLHSDNADKDIEYIICNSLETLLYMNNLGCIEINPWNSRKSKLDFPDYMVMDIDPSENNSFDQVIDTALVIKEILDKAEALSYCKTSGASGLHIYIPLHAAYDYDQARSFAEIIASLTVEQLPKITTIERSLNQRKGRIYVDYLQNKRGQTLASVYSVRPVEGASVSTPLEWKEVKHGLLPSDFTIHNVLDRVTKKGDLFGGVLKEKTNLKKCLKNLGA
jgi:bifunctional non-homologous end joining protein LigD